VASLRLTGREKAAEQTGKSQNQKLSSHVVVSRGLNHQPSSLHL
jgi:hypothetical protein